MPQTDLLDALIDKLGAISPVWSETFAASAEIDVAGFKRTQLMIREYGESTVRRAFETAIDAQIVPKGRSALGLMHSLCKGQAL